MKMIKKWKQSIKESNVNLEVNYNSKQYRFKRNKLEETKM